MSSSIYHWLFISKMLWYLLDAFSHLLLFLQSNLGAEEEIMPSKQSRRDAILITNLYQNDPLIKTSNLFSLVYKFIAIKFPQVSMWKTHRIFLYKNLKLCLVLFELQKKQSWVIRLIYQFYWFPISKYLQAFHLLLLLLNLLFKFS